MDTGKRRYQKASGFSGAVCRFAAFLLVMTLVSFCTLSGLLAKYTVSGTGGDSARVAAFGNLTLTETNTGGSFLLVPGASVLKDPVVSMTASEVAVRVSVTLTLGSGWTTENFRDFRFRIEGQTVLSWSVDPAWQLEKQDGSAYTFRKDLAPGQALENQLVIAGGVIAVSEEIAYTDYYDTIDAAALEIAIRATAKQLD